MTVQYARNKKREPLISRQAGASMRPREIRPSARMAYAVCARMKMVRATRINSIGHRHSTSSTAYIVGLCVREYSKIMETKAIRGNLSRMRILAPIETCSVCVVHYVVQSLARTYVINASEIGCNAQRLLNKNDVYHSHFLVVYFACCDSAIL